MEEWRTIDGWPYSVSSLGRVRRDVGGQGTRCAVLKNSRDRNGYAVVNLRKNNTGAKHYVHRLVAAAFLPPRPSDKHHVAHWDGDGMNARAVNLRWVTQSENEADKKRHGRDNYTAKGSRFFTADEVTELRAMRASGLSINQIKLRTGCGSWNTVKTALDNGARI